MKPSSEKPHSHARVASQVRGRLRVKFDHRSRSKAQLERIEQYLESKHGIGDVVVNAATGSMTIPYDHAKVDGKGIFQFLEDLDVVVESTLHPPAVDEAGLESGRHPGFTEAIDDLDAYVRRAIGMPMNLRLVLPLALVAAGAWSIARRGLMIETVPGWVFLWLAFDTFVKLHPERGPAPHPAPDFASRR
ncbi:hypothetical protein B0G57_102426 [Trinickia symbiotica]|uniref:HMA2 domain-containing protein n=1 Tax=Trinickia symbiotica TaxID=863227 RepID=UPI000C87B02A|nr:hypothetical protein [Trinickia symbiotica]PPK46831.1 hypothetical protein B0G57_102426 [Trinickia symbiotica]